MFPLVSLLLPYMLDVLRPEGITVISLKVRAVHSIPIPELLVFGRAGNLSLLF